MSTSRDTTPASNKSNSNSLFRHTYVSALATFIVHPLRVLLNRASMHQNPVQTIKEALPRMPRGVPNNIIRGGLSAGTQSFAKTHAQEHGGFIAGIAASAVAGTIVATLAETRLIRQISMPLNQTAPVTLWRFCVPLSSLYFMREVGFTMAVLAKNDLSPGMQHAALASAALVTAITHKFAVIEASRDLLPKEINTPDFRQGVTRTIRAMSNGGIYNHPAFQVPFKNPSNIFAKSGNFLHVACGANMYCFRLLYLFAFREAYHLTSSTPTSISSTFRFFTDRKTAAIPPASAYRPPQDTGTPKKH